MSDAKPKPQEVVYSGNLSSSKIPNLKLITTHFLHRLADRCDLGIERKGDKAWNACSSNQSGLTDIDFAIERCSHTINHALILRDKLVKAKYGGRFEMGDDDAAGMAWNAMYLCEVTRELVPNQPPKQSSCPYCVAGVTASEQKDNLGGFVKYTSYLCPHCKGTGVA